MLTQTRVKELFDYRNDGELIWKVPRGNCKSGTITGRSLNRGYKVVGIDKISYLCHRVVWIWHYGYSPENFIDHIDRNKKNNKIENLREVSASCNLRNTNIWKNNTSGVKGVVFCHGGWEARIGYNGGTYLGRFADFGEAVSHRLAAEQCANWKECDASSPAFIYVKTNIQKGEVI